MVRKNLILLNFRSLFMPLPSPVGIRDADRPEQGFLPLGDHTEYGNLKFVAPECLLRVQEYLAPGWRVGGLGYTTRQRNTHSIESREVCYPWHPWYRRSAWIYETLVKNGQAVFRCSIEETGRRSKCSRTASNIALGRLRSGSGIEEDEIPGAFPRREGFLNLSDREVRHG